MAAPRRSRLVSLAVRLVPALRRDAERRREAERALAESEARHRAMVRSLPDAAVLLFDHDLRYAAAEGPGLERIGWAPDALVGRRLRDVLPDERIAEVEPLYRRALAGESSSFETSSPRGRRTFSVDVVPVRDAAGGVAGGMVVARDITDRRLAEKIGEEAEARFRRAFEQAPIGMAMVALDGHWLRVNRAVCRMLGYEAGQLVGMTFAEVTHPEDLESDLEQVQRCIAGDLDAYELEKRYLTAGGETLVAQLSVSIVRDEADRPLYFLSQLVDVTERRRAEARLEHLADHDSLTGLLNRRRFGQELERQVTATRANRSCAALIMLDLDHFKYVNDTLGHPVGDQLLRRVATALQARLRDTDLVARLGGDEFAVLLPDTPIDDAERVARDLIALIRRNGVVLDGRSPHQVTASAGLVAIDPCRRDSAEALLVHADIALYDAKDAGRATVSVRDVDDDRSAATIAGVAWADRIRTALAEDRFVLYQQPIRDLTDGTVTRHEILLRMVGDDGEHILPGQFLDAAERFGLIADVDIWVVRRAMGLIAAQAAAGNPLQLEVNLSGVSLTTPRVIEVIERGLAETGIDPGALTFEITETAAISNMEEARGFAQRIAALGCHFALDDFGAGFGSFYYLKHLPFDVLKIDGEFVRGLAGSPRDQLLVRTIAELAGQLGSRTVAEFVEDSETQELLRGYGVDFAQGYLVGRPEPVATAWPVPARAALALAA